MADQAGGVETRAFFDGEWRSDPHHVSSRLAPGASMSVEVADRPPGLCLARRGRRGRGRGSNPIERVAERGSAQLLSAGEQGATLVAFNLKRPACATAAAAGMSICCLPIACRAMTISPAGLCRRRAACRCPSAPTCELGCTTINFVVQTRSARVHFAFRGQR